MRPSFEKLIPPSGSSIRCFDRSEIEKPANWHYHPEVELTFVERGAGTRFVGDHIGSFRDGDLVMLGANLPHHWASDQYRGERYDRHPAIVIQFLPEQLGDVFLSMPEMESIGTLIDRSMRGLEFVGHAQQEACIHIRRMLNQEPFERLVTLFYCLKMLSITDEVKPLASESYSPSFRRKTQSRLHEVCQYINECLTDPELSQAQVAQFANMTPAAFSRFFKNATQRTVTEYINELRVGLASRMLLETDQSILDVCLRSGFENASNFNRRFRQFKRMSPREYRANYRQHMEPVGVS